MTIFLYLRVELTATGGMAPSGVLLGPGTAPGQAAGCTWLCIGSISIFKARPL